MPSTTSPLLQIQDLSVTFTGRQSTVRAVKNVSLTVGDGEVLALVGESGSGKSVTASAIVGLLPAGRGTSLSGSIRFRGRELLGLPDTRLNSVRGRQIGTIFQNPASSLDPSFKIGSQMRELIRHHLGLASSDAVALASEWLDRVGIRDVDRVLDAFPHQLSGGMRQRVMIAIACIPSPSLLIADEPTTALDATIQKQVLTLLAGLRRDLGISILIVTHDFGVVSYLSDRVAVLRRGELVEAGTTEAVLAAPQHPYTRLLIGSVPTLGSSATHMPPMAASADGAADTLVSVEDVVQSFVVRGTGLRKSEFVALDHVSLTIRRGDSLALIGESGSGKTTLGRIITGLLTPTEGRVAHEGMDNRATGREQLRKFRRSVQIVFQDHGSALNPRLRIGPQITRPVVRLGIAQRGHPATEVAGEMLGLVGLSAEYLGRYPHQLSGGERQRVGIARALAVRPDLVVLDEPTSALDVSTQAQIIDLLITLRDTLGLTFVLIAHNLAVVDQFADHVIVLKDGRVVDRFATADFRDDARDPVTRELVDSVLPPRRSAESGAGQ